MKRSLECSNYPGTQTRFIFVDAGVHNIHAAADAFRESTLLPTVMPSFILHEQRCCELSFEQNALNTLDLRHVKERRRKTM